MKTPRPAVTDVCPDRPRCLLSGRRRVGAPRHGRSSVLAPTAQLLKRCTASLHDRVEADLDLVGPQVTAARLHDVVLRLYGFWATTEPLVTAWAEQAPAELRMPLRARVPHLRADVAALGGKVATAPLAPPVFRGDIDGGINGGIDDAAALGWLYVTEGSTLGGVMIDRHLASLGQPLPTLRSFTPYEEGPGPMWRAYLRHLEQWAGVEPHRPAAVAAAAVTVFRSLADWVAPLAVGAAA